MTDSSDTTATLTQRVFQALTAESVIPKFNTIRLQVVLAVVIIIIITTAATTNGKSNDNSNDNSNSNDNNTILSIYIYFKQNTVCI